VLATTESKGDNMNDKEQGQENIEGGFSEDTEKPQDKRVSYAEGRGVYKSFGLEEYQRICFGPGGPPCSKESR